MKIGNIIINDEAVFQQLEKTFENKNPTNRTILILKLFCEKSISIQELKILQSPRLMTNKKGQDLKKIPPKFESGIRKLIKQQEMV
ncbi:MULTISPECIES: hypothetical protein [Aerococcus]|uniref:hypothetical protein n=1 Tax=Aerococcus TaxID=1375 RepID=UPI000DCC7EFE|nr:MULTISPECIES: hypothetical protein [Aerococcus]MDK6597071.1 hypothetical protein [Aerococcus urinae]MDK7802017.1 hypothetical protein [Aerococcus urinae]MDK8655604.1 hypothetical protein [Aerococcus urinae]MDL5178543.1 hypothetical protein [Aerococcus tenax]